MDRHFRGGKLVIDLGCGDGNWIDTVSKRYDRALGFDISRDRLNRRSESVVDWEFIQADLNEGIPLPDGVGDGVRANQVIEHIANPMYFVAEAFRVLRPGGVLVVTTPNLRYLRHLMRLVVGGKGPITSGEGLRTRENWDDGHIHFFTSGDLEWLAAMEGFSRVRTQALIETQGGAAFIRRSLDRFSSTWLVKGFLTGNLMLVARK